MLGMKSRDDLLVPAEARGAGHGAAREAPGNAPELALGSRRQQDLPRSFDGLTFRPCDAETGGELAARNSAIQLSPPNRFSDLQPAKTLSPAAWRAAQTSRKTRSNSGGRASKKLALDGNFYGVFGEVSASNQARQTTLPFTTVAACPPRNRCPSKGEFLLFDSDSPTL